MNRKRWLTPILITAYIVAVLLISGFSRTDLIEKASKPVGETLADRTDNYQSDSLEPHR